ncbi:hypothetical protein BDN72DRAFT_838090 [Pluteus cervinus]|uniref:Uncharacterized protein n=1 Tax=Pluteus cervinus TaxID=181527 RepID=A0ACD3B0Q0_9AGAR|nr:hypothetical protein BDN72DRAFT_838090 [Pluteus cervinus]
MTIDYPPQAHTHPSMKDKGTTRQIISEQPKPSTNMNVTPETASERDKPLRLRGGCVPCPGNGCCFVIPLPCCC